MLVVRYTNWASCLHRASYCYDGHSSYNSVHHVSLSTDILWIVIVDTASWMLAPCISFAADMAHEATDTFQANITAQCATHHRHELSIASFERYGTRNNKEERLTH